MKRFLFSVGTCSVILWTFLAIVLPCSPLSAQPCGNVEFEARKILFQGDFLPIQMVGFFPYSMSGKNIPPKYAKEAWSGSGDYSFTEAFTSTTTHYTGIKWSGDWTFDPSTGAETSTKELSYHVVGPYGVDTDIKSTELKLGLGDPGSLTGGPDSTSATKRRYVGGGGSDTRSITESLSDAVSLDDAVRYGENHKSADDDSRQYWDRFPSADAVAASMGGTMTRLSPLKAHGRRVSFQAQFSIPCLKRGKFMITYYYKRWKIGEPEPARYTTFTEKVEFKEEPYIVPEGGGFRRYDFELKQGEQCKLVKVTARPLADCKDREPGGSHGANHSVDMQFHLGRTSFGDSAGSLAVAATEVSPDLYTPAALTLLALGDATTEVIKDGDILRQVKAPETFVDIVTLTSSSYELRFYLPSQVGDFNGGVYAVSGSPFATYLVDDPGGTGSVRFTETRGSQRKVTVYTYDSDTGSMVMTSDGGARQDTFEKVVSDSTVTETRTIQDASNQTASVVREVKTIYSFGKNPTQRILDPDGVNLVTRYTYYTDPVNDGGGYGQIKRIIEPTGRWTRYTYDGEGRIATTTRQFLDSPVTSADNLNRVTSVTFDTIADRDGDNKPEKLCTRIESLLGREIGRSYVITFSDVGVAYGAKVETRWNIQCTMPGAAWDAATNLVTKSRALDSGDWFGKPLSELRADGTMTTYAYVSDGSTSTTTVLQGAANDEGTAVTSGIRTVTVETLLGRLIGRKVYDYPSDTLVASELVTEFDSIGRPTRIDFLDGTHEQLSYACCGLDLVIDRQGVATNYFYNSLGEIDRESRAGIAFESVLDPDGRLLVGKRIGTDGSEIVTESHGYDHAGRPLWSRDALGRQTNFSEAIDGNGHTVKTTTHPDGGTIIQAFAKDGSLLSVAGIAAPQRTAYEYGVDADGLFTKEIRVGVDNEATEWVKSYSDFAGRPHKRVYADGASEASYYNSAGQLVRQVDADGVTTLFAYNSRGAQEIIAVDLNGNNTIDYTVDRITRTTSDLATRDAHTVHRRITETWETAGQDTPVAVAIVETAVDALRSWHTARGLLTTISTMLDGKGGCTIVTTVPDGTTTTQIFLNDLLSSLVTHHPSLGILASTSCTYDSHGRLRTQTEARNGTTTYTYFDDDQIRTIATPDPDTTRSGDGYDSQTTFFAYDDAGRQSEVTQPDSTVVNTSYWPTGAVKRTWGSRVYPVEYSYDTQGRVKTLTTWRDFAGNSDAAVTTWNYSPARGFLLNKRYADNTGPAYTYKASGRLLTRTWARGTISTYGYNAAGDASSVDYSDTTADINITYDRAVRPKTITDGSGTRTFTYDASGQLMDENYIVGQLNVLGVRRSFDVLNRLVSVSAISGSFALNPVAYSYDAASRLDAVTSGANTVTYEYVANSPLVGSITVKQGGAARLSTVKNYDGLNRLISISSTPSAGPVLNYSYDYNSANQRTRATREDNSYWSYGHDTLGQVNSAARKFSTGTTVNGFDFTYTYDDIGNRKTTSGGGMPSPRDSTYSTNALNQYTQRTVSNTIDLLGTAVTDANVTVNGESVTRQGEWWHRSEAIDNTAVSTWNEFTIAGVRSGQGPGGSDAVAVSTRKAWVPKTPEVFTYDADGNLAGDGRWSYAWDGENRLIAMETRLDVLPPHGNFPLTERRRLEFAYDAEGRRIEKKIFSWNGHTWVPGVSTRFVYDGWNLLAEIDGSSGLAVRCYTWGLDLSGTLQGAAGAGGLLSLTGNGATHAACYDGNGNLSMLVDLSNGVPSAQYEYDPFGNSLATTGAFADFNPFRFSTRYTDDDTKLVYYGLRYYSPVSGKWLSKDPFEERGGNNLYGFVAGDPIGNVDVLGLAGFFFDGTGNTKRDNTNVLLLLELYQGFLRYYPGVGTSFGSIVIGGLTGAGKARRLRNAYRDFITAVDEGDRYVDIFGFSRGGSIAREFANLLNERGYDPSYGGKLPYKLRAATSKPPGECEFSIRFVGLFDSVGSFGVPGNHINIGVRMALPDAVGNAAQAVALNERRFLFPLTPLGKREGFFEQGFPGDHSDIGGGHGKDNNDLSRSPLEYIWSQGKAAGVPFKDLPEYTPTGNTTPHDLSRKFPHNLFPKRPRKL